MGCSWKLEAGSWNSSLDCLEEIAARRDDRFDELPVGILVSAVRELRKRVHPVGTFVVDAREVERAKRIVRRPDHEQPRESPGPLFERIPDTCGFESGERVGGVAAKIPPLGAQFVRTSLRRERRHENDLLGASSRHLLEQPRQAAWPVADAMRLSPPRAFRRECHEVRLGRQRDRHTGGKRIDGVIARDAGKVEGFGRSRRRFTAWTREEPRPMRLGKQRKHEVTPRIHVVHGHEELAEAWLTEIL